VYGMLRQPFCVWRHRVVVACASDMCLRVCDPTTAAPHVQTTFLPADMPYVCEGCAGSDASSRLVVADSMQGRLIFLGPALELVRQVTLPHGLCPWCVTRAHDRFWFLAEPQGALDIALGWVDDSGTEAQFPEVQVGWSPPLLNLAGVPVVLAHHAWLVLFNSLAGRLYWLGDRCNIAHVERIPSDVVLGPCESGDLVFVSPSDPAGQLYIIDRDRAIAALPDLHVRLPAGVPVGLCIASERVFAMADTGAVYSLRKGHADWCELEDAPG